MLGHDARGQAYGLLRADGAVCPHFKREFIIVCNLPHAGVLYPVVHFQNRGIDAVHRQRAKRRLFGVLLVALGRHIAAALVERQLHNELCAVGQRGNVPIGVQNLELGILLNAAGSHFALAGRLDAHRLGGVRVQFCRDALHIQHNLGHVFLDALNCRELVHHTVDFDAGDCNAGQAGKQHAAQAVAKRRAKAALQRFYHKFAIAAIGRKVRCIDPGPFDLHHRVTLL